MKKKTNPKVRAKIVDRPVDILKQIELSAARLVSSMSHLELRSGPLPTKTKVGMECNIGRSNDEPILLINMKCEITARYDEADKDPAVLIRSEYQAVYNVLSGLPLEQVDVANSGSTLTSTATLQLWPFLRHHVFWISSQMGIPPITLPMFKVAIQGLQFAAPILDGPKKMTL